MFCDVLIFILVLWNVWLLYTMLLFIYGSVTSVPNAAIESRISNGETIEHFQDLVLSLEAVIVPLLMCLDELMHVFDLSIVMHVESPVTEADEFTGMDE